MSTESFHFLRPAWLLALAALAPLFWLAWRERRAPGAWRRVCDANLLRHLVLQGSEGGRRLPLALLAIGWIAACVALAGPTWQRLPQPAWRTAEQTVLVLELSPSMRATDVPPSRLARGRYELLDALARAEGGVGLVIFAQEPYPVTPLTDDPGVIAEQVPLLEPELMPGRGTRVDRAIDEAHALLAQAGAARGRIVVLGDGLGDAPEAALEAAARAARAGFAVSALGLGEHASALASLAEEGEGRFALAAADDSDWDHLLFWGTRGSGVALAPQETDVQTDVWRDMGAWLALIPLALAPLGFRRGWTATLGLLVFLAVAPTPASAELADWWSRADQRGARAFADGDHERAAALFEDPSWKAAAQYRDGSYDAARETLEGLDDSRAHYNRGNALAHANRLEEAVAAYDRVLEIEPDHDDARYNREVVKQLLEQQKPEQQQDRQQQNQQGQQQQDPQQQDQQGEQEQRDQHGQQGEQQPQDQQGQQQQPRQDQDQQGQQQPRDGQDQQGAQQQQQQQEQQAEPLQPHPQLQPRPQEGRPGQEPPDAPETARAGDPTEPEEARSDEREGPPRGRAGERELSESDQETEQWLNRVPDDPGGLLREKLRRRYLRRQAAAALGGRR